MSEEPGRYDGGGGTAGGKIGCVAAAVLGLPLLASAALDSMNAYWNCPPWGRCGLGLALAPIVGAVTITAAIGFGLMAVVNAVSWFFRRKG